MRKQTRQVVQIGHAFGRLVHQDQVPSQTIGLFPIPPIAHSCNNRSLFRAYAHRLGQSIVLVRQVGLESVPGMPARPLPFMALQQGSRGTHFLLKDLTGFDLSLPGSWTVWRPSIELERSTARNTLAVLILKDNALPTTHSDRKDSISSHTA